jgi:hypothetical protein
MTRLRVLLAVATLLVGWPAAAHAADPGRWTLTGVSRIPYVYYQGVTADGRGHLFFDGVFAGLYRADEALREQARQDDEIPPQVFATEGYDHIGDITWDPGSGGRVLLPLECYYPKRPGGENSCRTGAIGVADPDTLAWRYYVKLDPAEIPKAMWAEVAPDGRELWTSVGDDLLAYRVADVAPANAGPAGPVLHAVRRLPGAVPPSGITGATFYDGRLFVAGQQDDRFQVWSIDLASGARRLEIERTISGESEGLVVVRALGGVLHWLVTPVDPAGRPPTYGPESNVLLNFMPAGAASGAPGSGGGGGSGPGGEGGPPPGRAGHHRGRLRLRATPRVLHAGRATRVRFTATTVRAGRRVPVARALVRFAGHRARTSRRGKATLAVRLLRTGPRRATVTRAGLRRGAVRLYVVRGGS